MSTQASNTHALLSVTFHDKHTHNKMPILVTHHDKQEHSQLDKQGLTDETVLPWWRTTIRAQILSSMKRESPILARMRARVVYHFNMFVYVMTFCKNAYDARGWTCISSIVQLWGHIHSS